MWDGIPERSRTRAFRDLLGNPLSFRGWRTISSTSPTETDNGPPAVPMGSVVGSTRQRRTPSSERTPRPASEWASFGSPVSNSRPPGSQSRSSGDIGEHPPSHARLRSGELHHHRYAPCRRTAYDLRTGRKAFVVAYRRRDFRRRILAERRIAASRSAAYRLGDKRYPPKGDRHPGGEGRKGRDAHSGDRLPDHVGRDRSRCSLRRGSFSPASFHAVRRCAHSGPAVAGTKPPAPGCFVAIANAPIADPHPRTRNSPLDR